MQLDSNSVFVYKLSGCGFESSCSLLNFRFCACFEQRVPSHLGNYRVWIHSEACTWRDKNIKLKKQGFSQEGKNSVFCVNWEIKCNWGSGGGGGHCEPLSGFRGGPGINALGKFTMFSLKLVYSLLELIKWKLSVCYI